MLENIDVEQLVAWEGYEYKLSNGNKGLQINVKTCPRCHREDYKVYLNAHSGLGNCFGCGSTFNKFSFVKACRGFKNNPDTIRYISSIEKTVSYRPKLKPIDFKLNEDWKLPLNKRIELEEDVPAYLIDRNVDSKICKRFDLRYCENGFYEYEAFDSRTRFVDFSNRILIPVYNIDGNLVTFQGRDTTGKSEKKYLFPNMLPGTGRFIYNASYAVQNRAKVVVLSEGCFDVWAVTQALESDLKYRQYIACGTFGKHLSISKNNMMAEDQLSDLFKLSEAGVEEFVILWDGEHEAIEAAISASLALNDYGLHSTVATLTGGLDPAEASIGERLLAIDKRFKPTKFDLVRMRLLNEHS